MALSYNACLFHHSLFTIVLLLLAPLATTTLQDPSLAPAFYCYPTELPAGHPTPHYCGAAIAALPYSRIFRDYHLDPGSGNIILNTALTTVGDPGSDLHLPRTSALGDCRVEVWLPPSVEFAHLLWDDVRSAAHVLVERCVGNIALMPSQPGPGGGGTAQLGNLLIIITYTPSAAQPGSPSSRPPSREGQEFRIAAHYPSRAQA